MGAIYTGERGVYLIIKGIMHRYKIRTRSWGYKPKRRRKKNRQNREDVLTKRGDYGEGLLPKGEPASEGLSGDLTSLRN